MNLNKFIGFDWDTGNNLKNWTKHNVANFESEQIFSNDPLLIHFDDKHSMDNENRYFALGNTNEHRKLAISFTTRNDKIRIISARDMSKKERIIYEKESKKDTEI